jgi:ferric-dicitrate binding protein FerR (iron transport regulator)
MKDEFLHFNAEDFVQDESFIEWMNKGSKNHDNKWGKWLKSHPEKLAEIEKARALFQDLTNDSQKINLDTNALWSRINKSILQDEKRHSQRKKIFFIVSSAAAACIAFLLIMQIISPRQTVIYADRGDNVSHMLPDLSSVTMNAETKISYRNKSWLSDRKLKLEGEALFDVRTGDQFVVETSQGEIQVLGTRFNVYDRDGYFEVRCLEGKVRVSIPGSYVILQAGEYCSQVDKLLIKSSFNGVEGVSLVSNIYSFRDQPLLKVFNALERQFDIQIKSGDEIKDELYTGFFQNSNLDSALYQVCWPMRLKVNKKGKSVIISREPTE